MIEEITLNLLKDPKIIQVLKNLELYDKGELEIDISDLQNKLTY